MTEGKRTSRRRASLLVAALCLLAAPAAPSSAQEAGQKQGVRPAPPVNVRPFKDFLAEATRLLDEGRLSRQTAFDSTIDAELDASGSLKPETIQARNTAGDAEGMRLAARLIEAISESRLLSILDGAKEVRLAVKLDGNVFSASASGELESEEKAAQYAHGYGLLFHAARLQKKDTRFDELYGGLSAASEGRRFFMKLELPKEAAVRLFRKAAEKVPAPAGAGRN